MAFEVVDAADRMAPATPAPDRPARPQRPYLVPPGEVPRRKLGAPTGRVALLHALAHIELNAIDLAFDMAVRFARAIADLGLDVLAFTRDWVRIGREESRHFQLLAGRLAAYGAAYGDLPAHDGLWTAAERTRDDVLARLAVAPMLLEARGLDVTPVMAERLADVGDPESAAAVRAIYQDEIGHVAAGVYWFESVCGRRLLAPEATFQALVRSHFEGGLKPPFNDEGRRRAGMRLDFYTNVN
jgi:uncharacterized ferritin-like protein (DUF455 family)